MRMICAYSEEPIVNEPIIPVYNRLGGLEFVKLKYYPDYLDKQKPENIDPYQLRATVNCINGLCEALNKYYGGEGNGL